LFPRRCGGGEEQTQNIVTKRMIPTLLLFGVLLVGARSCCEIRDMGSLPRTNDRWWWGICGEEAREILKKRKNRDTLLIALILKK
jgi:hypothetical protein